MAPSDAVTAFPRGKRTKTAAATAAGDKKDGDAGSNAGKDSSTAKKRGSDNSNDKGDFLFGSSEQDKDVFSSGHTKKKRKNEGGGDDLGGEVSSAVDMSTNQLPLGGGAVLPPAKVSSSGRKMPAKIELLGFSKLARGTKVLGVIREVQDEYAVVSLPTMLTGFVKRVNNGPPLTRVLPGVGTVMAFSIRKTVSEDVASSKSKSALKPTQKRRIELSPLPVHVNEGVVMNDLSSGKKSSDNSFIVRGVIRSVEDHGCLIDLGSFIGGSQRAFLKFDKVEGAYEVLDEEGGSDDDSADEADAMDIDGESDKSSVKRLINRGRVYDFCIIPTKQSGGGSDTIIQLSLPSNHTLARMRTTFTSPSMKSLMPGMLVETQVEHHAKNGLCVAFMKGVYRGAIDEDHLGGYRGMQEKKLGGNVTDGGMWWKNVFKGRHKIVTARIIAVDAATRIVRFSLLPHILSLESKMEFPHPIGTVIKNASVIRVDPGVGALLALPASTHDEEDKAETTDFDVDYLKLDVGLSNNLMTVPEYRAASKVRAAYVHISKSMDDASSSSKKGKGEQKHRTSEVAFAREFIVNSSVKALRILSTSNHVDGIASCATAESIVNAHVLTHGDIQPGTVYKNVNVLSLLDAGGVLVELGHGIRGIVPAMHLFDKASKGSDYQQKIRLEKFKVGNKVDVRCLSVDPSLRRCILTAKKTLLTSDSDSPITDYTKSVTLDKLATGFITNVDDRGLVVTFFNNVHGRVSSRSLAAELGVEDPRMNYNLGDVVKARVEDCRQRRNRKAHNSGNEYYHELTLSLNTVVKIVDETKEIPSSSDQKDSKKTRVNLAAGSILPPKSMKIVEVVGCLERADGTFLPGYATVSVKSKFVDIPSGGDSIDCKLPFDQLFDSYKDMDPSIAKNLEELARGKLKIGKKIDERALIVSVPRGNGLPILALRPSLIQTVEIASGASSESAPSSATDLSIICPSPTSNIFMGANVRGYVTKIDSRYGAFVRFLDGLTGLIPKSKKGLDENLYETVLCKVHACDITSSPPKILLIKTSEGDVAKKQDTAQGKTASYNANSQIEVGDDVGVVRVTDVNFARASVTLNDKRFSGLKIRARIHVTMADPLSTIPKMSKEDIRSSEEHKISKNHPFYGWKAGDIIHGAKCVAVNSFDGCYIDLTNRCSSSSKDSAPVLVSDPSCLPSGSVVSGMITSIASTPLYHGLWVQICPGTSGFISALELSSDAKVLNDVKSHYTVGSRISCCVMDKTTAKKSKIPLNHRLEDDAHDGKKNDHHALDLSVLLLPKTETDKQPTTSKVSKPQRGDAVVGKIIRMQHPRRPPSLMLVLRGGFLGRCCVTELSDADDWINMPLGRMASSGTLEKERASNKQDGAVTDSDADMTKENDDNSTKEEDEADDGRSDDNHSEYPSGKFFNCRVLTSAGGNIDLSLRGSRLDGDLEDDALPQANGIVRAYVTSTSKKGCFVRLSRFVEGRVILKELSDDFVPDPVSLFPPGRLVVGKIKDVLGVTTKKKSGNAISTRVNIDMRESVLLESGERLTIDDINKQSKYTGIITRVESYGVFVRIDNSNISGLAHLSECSDNYIKNIEDLYNPGDLVKVLVIKKDDIEDSDRKRIGLSLKASNFIDDEDSDGESDSDSSDDEQNDDAAMSESDNSSEESEDEESADSDDENFVSKMAAKLKNSKEEDDSDDDSSDEDQSSGSESEDDSDEEPEDELRRKGQKVLGQTMDTNVGFDWGTKPTKSKETASSDEDSSDSSSDESEGEVVGADDTGVITSHKSRKKAATKKKEEEDISRREAALADGTADENPETTADFERLVTSSPNSSEVWIKYMAFHLSLADIESARNVANRAFDRIEFREEGEKLNVWTALLTLELKYGSDKTLQQALDRACQHNNPKHVHLRICELLGKEVDAASSSVASIEKDKAIKRADEMFAKMCKKFKNKKTVWIAHFEYLLRSARHEEAHALLKRSLKSLPSYKHIEAMSKFAQMEFELGSPERGRTIFDSLLEKHPKRMDLLFVHVDKEIKNGEIESARALFESVVNPVSDEQKFNFSDKQMKSLFKKWYRTEEDHGDDESRERVKTKAKSFVERTSTTSS